METEITTKKMNYINSFTYPSDIIKDKINYFVDCIDLLSAAQGMAFCPINLNTRLLCKVLLKVLTTDNDRVWDYTNHYFKSYGDLLSTELAIIKENYLQDFESLNDLLNQFLKDKKADFDTSSLVTLLKKLEVELNESYFEKVLTSVSKAVLCSEDISKHNHKDIIEHGVEMLIAEFYSIGWSRGDLQTVFDTAVMYNKSFVDKVDNKNIYKIPVPHSIYEKINEPYEEYKKLVIDYLEKATLPDQFKNLIYIYKRAVCPKSFIFRIRNLRLYDESSFTCYDTTISKDLINKFTDETTNERFKDFFKIEDGLSFCEVEVISGNNVDALQKAIIKANEALNYINYNYGDDSRKANLDVSKYVIKDGITTNLIQKNAIGMSEKEIKKHHSFLHELEGYKFKPSVAFYMNIDKTFFQAFNAPTNASTVSILWRYCESLFLNKKEAKIIIKRLVAYYCKRNKYQDFVGAFRMVSILLNDFRYSSRHAELNMTSEELWNLLHTPDKECLTRANELIKHFLINKYCDLTLKLTPEEKYSGMYIHFHKILKGAYIQRNLYQHSNIVIDEIQNIWLDRFCEFIGSLRLYIIEDLKSNPDIKNVEDLFPIPTEGVPNCY